MKQILLFGAGKSATVLIDHLAQTAAAKSWRFTVADANADALHAKTANYPSVNSVVISIENETERQALVKHADVVISLLPPSLHYRVALDCLAFCKHLLTASYVDEKIRALSEEVRSKGILFLCEMGLDPGIDHLSAMQLIHRLQDEGAEIVSFRSHCGGLVAPESDNNPWHYKISWNPRNIVLAGKAGAVYKVNGEVQQKPYSLLFTDCPEVSVDGVGALACYPNRDSLSYIPIYHLENTATFERTTLRHPDFCSAWDLIVQSGLTDEETTIDTTGLSISSFLRRAFDKNDTAFTSDRLKNQFDFLGWNDDTPINQGICSSADALQHILEQKWKLDEGDKDMIVMLHEIGYLLDGKRHDIRSELVVKGNDVIHTAMAKTVGLPLAIASILLLEEKITETGVHIPITPGIYEPVLQELAQHGIIFKES